MSYYDENGELRRIGEGITENWQTGVRPRRSKLSLKGEPVVEIVREYRSRKEGTVDHGIQHPAIPNSVTIPCHRIRIGDVLFLEGRPCQVIRISTSTQTGQHKYLGVDLFTKELHEEKSIVSHPSESTMVQTMLGPVFKQYRVLDVQGDTIVAMSEVGDVRTGVEIGDHNNLRSRLFDAFSSDQGIRILVLRDAGREMAIDMNVIHPADVRTDDPHASSPEDNGEPANVKLFAFNYLPRERRSSSTLPTQTESTAIMNTSPFFDINKYHICLTENRFETNTGRSFLKVLDNSSDHIPPLYHWIHLGQLDGSKSSFMSFDEFACEAEKIARELSNWSRSELRALSKVVRRVRNEFKKTNSSLSTNTPSIEPSFCTETAFQEDFMGNNVPSSKTVSWICLPYIYLKEYSESSHSIRDSYPIHSLMHGRSPNSGTLNQVVYSSPKMGRDHCYHVAQTWCLILQNSLIITCGIFSADSLRLVKIVRMPEPSGNRQGEIIVSFGSSVKWLLPISTCETWFDFTTHFLEFWPHHLQFRHEGTLLRPEAWLDLLKNKSPIHLTLELLRDDEPEPTKHSFKALACLSPVSSDQCENPASSHGLLSSMESFLHKQVSSNAAYDNCEELDRKGMTLLDETGLLNYADDIFLFFFIEGAQGPTISKYWGAVNRLLTVFNGSTRREESIPATVEKELRSLVDEIRSLTRAFCYTSVERTPIDTPIELQQAWLHILMSFIDCRRHNAMYEQPMNTWQQHIRIASHLIKNGMLKVVQNLKGTQQSQLRDTLIPLPIDVAWQISADLLSSPEINGEKEPLSSDVVESYSQHFECLRRAVFDKPWDRSHLEKITFLKEEIKIVQEVFEKQEGVLSEMVSSQTEVRESAGGGAHQNGLPSSRRPNNNKPISGAHISPNDDVNREANIPSYNYFQSELPQNCLSATQYRIERLSLLQRELLLLETTVKKAIDDSKDQQASAIYAFTLVTVIFLPLSTIASIFGMNTNDIRNTDINQWLFWAVSLPITIIIVPLGLLWAGGRGNFSAALVYWFSGGGRRRER